MPIQPYLSFEGRADEAIEFYKKALGAKVEMVGTGGAGSGATGLGPGSGSGLGAPGWVQIGYLVGSVVEVVDLAGAARPRP